MYVIIQVSTELELESPPWYSAEDKTQITDRQKQYTQEQRQRQMQGHIAPA